MVRRGELSLPEGSMAFALIGMGGRFDDGHDLVHYDKDRDGRIDLNDPLSPERYQLIARHASNGLVASWSSGVEPICRRGRQTGGADSPVLACPIRGTSYAA